MHILQVEHVAVQSLTSDSANARTHDAANLRAITASLKRFGQQKPIVIDADGVVIAGNGTLSAAIELGWTTIAVVRSPLKGSEATAYAIADNRTAELAAWDEEALAEQLAALTLEDEELAMATGFNGTTVPAAIDSAPDEFQTYDESIGTNQQCPSCGFRWSAPTQP